MQTQIPDDHPTIRVFPRTLQEAFPKEYLNEGVFEGAYRDPQRGDFSVLIALIAVISFIVWGLYGT